MEKLLHEKLRESIKGQSWLTVGLHDDAFIIEKFAQHLIKRAPLIERGA